MNRIDHEDFLPLPEAFSKNFELILEIKKKSAEIREIDDQLNDALDAAYAADQKAAQLGREIHKAKQELQALDREWARRERLVDEEKIFN